MLISAGQNKIKYCERISNKATKLDTKLKPQQTTIHKGYGRYG